MVTHIVFLFVTLLTNVKSRLGKKSALFISFLVLFFFCALRYNFGNDYKSYLRHYEAIKNGITVFNNEIGFEMLNLISPNFYFMIAVISAIFLGIVYWVIKNHVDKEYYGIALLIWLINPYLFLMSLSALRQTIATIFFIGAVCFSYNRKPIPYVILILCAALFHQSVIILFPVYFIANNRRVGRFTIVAYVLLCLIMLLDTQLFHGIIEYGLSMFDNINYNYYYESDETGNSLRATILTGIYYIYLLLNLRKLEGWSLMSAKIYIIGLTVAILAFHTSMLTRIQMYMDIFSLVAIPSIMKVNKENIMVEEGIVKKIEYLLNRYILPGSIFFIYILRYYSFFINSRWSSFTTYYTIFDLL